MEKRQLNNIILLTVIFVALILVFGITMLFNMQTDESLYMEMAQKSLSEDYDDIAVVLDFLVRFGDEDVYISDANGKFSIGFTKGKIEDEQINKAIKKLLVKKGYDCIAKCGNTIYIQRWLGVRDISYGVAYSMDGSSDLEIDFLTESVALDKPNWYYFVADYEQWRVSQTEEGKGTDSQE